MEQEAKSSKPPTTIPAGFVLNEELVIYYLYNKVSGQPLPSGLAVKEYNIYGDNEPWEIWDIHGGPNLKKDEDLYFFTELKRKGVNGSRFVRKVGLNGGAWKAEHSAKVIQDRMTKRSIGIKKRFRYENSRSKHNGCWFMFEYSLHRSLIGHNAHVDDYVICRIQRKDGKRESENVEKGVEIASCAGAEIQLIEDRSETVGEAKESSLKAMNGDPPLQCSEIDRVRYTDWAIRFAEDLLQNQPAQLLEEKENEMVPNMLYTEKWLDWEQLK